MHDEMYDYVDEVFDMSGELLEDYDKVEYWRQEDGVRVSITIEAVEDDEDEYEYEYEEEY